MERTWNEIRELVEQHLRGEFGGANTWVWVRDITADWVVWAVEPENGEAVLSRAGYTIDDAGQVTLAAPETVQAKVEYEVVEATIRESGRVLEARPADADGGRVFHVQIIEAGDSLNGRRYPLRVLEAAVPLYEGAKAFDHHRTDAEHRTSSIDGLCGQYRNVEATSTGLVGDLHLLPSAAHVAEALDASVASQEAGGAPLVGISHDVLGTWKATEAVGRRRIQEAVKIVRVLSADVVADPSAGGRPIRVVAGGVDAVVVEPESSNQSKTLDQEEATMSLAEMLASATDEDKAALRGLVLDGEAATQTTTTDATTDEAADVDTDKELVTVGRESLTAAGWVRQAVESTGIDPAMILDVLPDRVTEAVVVDAVKHTQRLAESIEKRTLRPRATENAAVVTQDDLDKKTDRVLATLERRWQEGYTSLFDMYEDVTGTRIRQDSDGAHRLVREAWDLARLPGVDRASEAIDSSTFGQVLGDAMNRRLLAVWRMPRYDSWRQIASSVPVRDFRTQHVARLGGYGNLPAVGERGAYQPLTTTTDEEATYAVTKRGGTESFTFEAAKNDDIGALVRIPEALGRAAARTLHEFVWLTIFAGNATCTYDSTALFAAGHANTTAVALSQAGLTSLRQKMRDQAAYGETGKPLGLLPRFLIVPNDLEELAFQLVGPRAVPASGNASDLRNLHEGMTVVVVDEFADANDWYLAADKMDVPDGGGIEIGFLDGREDPELFMQDDPKVGTTFSSDEVTWKIRHIYSGTATDHRAFQRGTQS